MKFVIKAIPIIAALVCTSVIYAQESFLTCDAPPVHMLQDTLTIFGNFDGDPSNTDLIIGEHKFNPVAETANESSFIPFAIALGENELTVKESGFSCSGKIQIISMRAAISKEKLSRGEYAILDLSVSGLEAYEEDVSINITNHSPKHITLTDGDAQEWTIHPGEQPQKKIPVQGVKIGDFNIAINLQQLPADETTGKPSPEDLEGNYEPEEEIEEEETEEDEIEEDEGCGSVYGKVEDKTKRALRHIVVFIDGNCALCPPTKSVEAITIKDDCKKFDPSWAVVPAGATITVENTADYDCDITPQLTTKFKDNSGFEATLRPGEKSSFVAKEYHERKSGVPDDYGLQDVIHQNIDMSIFIAPNPCYCVVDEDGNYSIGELEPGTYTLKVYTYPQRSYTPVATVEIEPDEEVKCDFVLKRDQAAPKGSQ